jgi:excisionase family DNA binding protein
MAAQEASMQIAVNNAKTWEDRAALSPAETAEVLSVSVATVFRLLKRGELASVRIGGSRRIPTSAIQKVLNVGA